MQGLGREFDGVDFVGGELIAGRLIPVGLAAERVVVKAVFLDALLPVGAGVDGESPHVRPSGANQKRKKEKGEDGSHRLGRCGLHPFFPFHFQLFTVRSAAAARRTAAAARAWRADREPPPRAGGPRRRAPSPPVCLLPRPPSSLRLSILLAYKVAGRQHPGPTRTSENSRAMRVMAATLYRPQPRRKRPRSLRGPLS